MRPALRVVAPGLLTTVQDLGRIGFQHLGVPPSGALDAMSLRAANALAGNPPDTGALEVAYLGPTLVADADSVRVAVAGAEAAIDILPDEFATEGRRVCGLRSICLRRGEALRVGAVTAGAVLYVAVEGGFDIPPVLGSVSTYLRGGIGGWQGRALAVGDALPLRRGRADGARKEWQLRGFSLKLRPRIRAVIGPQDDYFSGSEIAAFFESEYVVGPSADRMGMRLTGRLICHRNGFDLASDGIAAGSIQIPGSGQPIVLLADRQTTGGYPKIATVISADLAVLGQRALGAKVAFEAVSLAAAQDALRQHHDQLAALPRMIAPLDEERSEVAATLNQCNLISGVVDAAA
jgi:biotin-dependent carboxylase-like uncharacterized protein